MDPNKHKTINKIKEFLVKSDDNNEEVLQQDFSESKVVQSLSGSGITVSVSGSSPLSICHTSLSEAGMLLESGEIIQHSLDSTTSIQLEDGATLIQNYEPNDECDSTEVAKFIDGQVVQLEDGSTAFIHAVPREGLQPVQLEDGTMAYLSQSSGELFNGEASSLDLENLTSSQQPVAQDLKKNDETLTCIDQCFSTQDIFCALTEANAHCSDTQKDLSEIKLWREEMVTSLINANEEHEDFFKKLENNGSQVLSQTKHVTPVQNQEETQRAEAELCKSGRIPDLPNVSQEQHGPKLKDYLPYLNKRGSGVAPTPNVPFNAYTALQSNVIPGHTTFLPESMRQATLGGPASANFDRSLKPSPTDSIRHEEKFDVSTIGVRPTPVGSEQTSVPAMCTTTLSNTGAGQINSYAPQSWNSMIPQSNSGSETPVQYPSHTMMNQCTNNANQLPITSNAVGSINNNPASNISYNYPSHFHQVPSSAVSPPQSFTPHSSYPASTVNIPGMQTTFLPSTSSHNNMSSLGSMPEQKSSESKSAYLSTSVPVPSTVIPSGVYYSNSYPLSSALVASSSFSSGSIHPANSVIQNNLHHSNSAGQLSPHQSNLSHPSNSVYQANSSVLSKTHYPSNSPVLGSVQPPGTGQYPAASAFSGISNYPASVLQNSAASSAVLQNYVPPSSGNILSGNYMASFSGTGDNNVAAGISSTSTTVLNNSYNLPYSLNEQAAYMTSSVGTAQQSQEYPSWQTNSMHLTNYNVQPSAYNVGASSNVQYNTSVNSTQYYHRSGASIQAKQACVTASMDARTLNSLNPYAISDSNVNYVHQNMNGYGISSINTSNTIIDGSAQLQANSPLVNQVQSNVPSAQVGNNVAYGSSPNIPYQHVLPTSNSTPQISSEPQISMKQILPNSCFADLQTTMPRDFITPPPDTVVNSEDEKEKTPVLQSHLKETPEVPFCLICLWKDCNMEFNDSSSLKDHLYNCHANTDTKCLCLWQTCKRNGKRFFSNFTFRRHLFTHVKENIFKCNYVGCVEIFKQDEDLCGHFLKHKKLKTCHEKSDASLDDHIEELYENHLSDGPDVPPRRSVE